MARTDLLPVRPAAVGAAPTASAAPAVEIVVPVFDEQEGLARSIRRLHAYLSGAFPLTWRIAIADNASADATLRIAHQLARELPGVAVVHVGAKGRGRALRAAWSATEADVVCYMDVDLSTDLRALLPLVGPLLSGHSDVAIGTRLARGARVRRGPKRELISRAYNRLLRATLRARFSDAQCGFKAVRADVARELLPAVRDEGWFFDTELLVLAQRRGLRIHEVPVDWVDDPDSRVDIVATALADLRGIVRLLATGHVARFAAVGVVSTLAYVLLYLALRGALGPGGANALALALTAAGNTAANRRLTFGVQGRAGLLRQHGLGAVVYLLTLALSAAVLGILHDLAPRAPRALEVTALVTATACGTITRYVALRTWVFAQARRQAPTAVAERPAADRAGC